MREVLEDKHKIRDLEGLIENCGKGNDKIEKEYAEQGTEEKIQRMGEPMQKLKEKGEISEQTLKVWQERITTFKKYKPFLDKYILDLEREFGEKVEFLLIFLRIKHPCFHPLINKNVVATNPYLDTGANLTLSFYK